MNNSLNFTIDVMKHVGFRLFLCAFEGFCVNNLFATPLLNSTRMEKFTVIFLFYCFFVIFRTIASDYLF